MRGRLTTPDGRRGPIISNGSGGANQCDPNGNCGQTFFAGESSVCTGAAFLASYGSGTFSLVGSYNASQLLKGI